MKTQIPDDLKADLPQTSWGKVLTATPVVMTVVATMLAGLASSEMTRAQYSRSLAAQQQSKAGDQWNFFQAKRLRGSMQRGTLDLIQSTATVRPLDTAELSRFLPAPGASPDPVASAALAALAQGTLPPLPTEPALAPALQTALVAVASSKPEDEVMPLVAAVDDTLLSQALRAAKDRATALDTALEPISRFIDGIERQMASSGSGPDSLRNFTAARLRYTAGRYEAEARVNQAVANLYELQVRRSNLAAERFHRRSQRFFFGMLGAQAGVIVSTFSLAARKRSMLWILAASAGIAAVVFAIYVYFYV